MQNSLLKLKQGEEGLDFKGQNDAGLLETQNY